jgi:biopolymer transport protein ExbD
MRVRRLHKKPAALEITAFLNLIVVLVPFLLSTAVFSRLAILNMSLPAQSNAVAGLKQDMKLEVVVRSDAVEVEDQHGGMIQRIVNLSGGKIDEQTLAALLEQIKARFPEKTDASVLAESNTPYDRLVAVMDAVRERIVTQAGKPVHEELFPDIAIGDAPEPLPASAARAIKGAR